jgi:hypothetical protein
VLGDFQPDFSGIFRLFPRFLVNSENAKVILCLEFVFVILFNVGRAVHSTGCIFLLVGGGGRGGVKLPPVILLLLLLFLPLLRYYIIVWHPVRESRDYGHWSISVLVAKQIPYLLNVFKL